MCPLIGAWLAFSTVFVRVLKEIVNIFFLYFGNTQFKQSLSICQKQQQQPRQTTGTNEMRTQREKKNV